LLATPAITQPQSAILGLGAVHKAPVVINDAIAIRSISYVTLTFDHRLIDGAIADRFMTHLKGVVEGWQEPIL
jgi:pyruvate/2-oxoglutarate dehydrogenase complex dihydrolipoamide acyltransferase (E2) component